MKLNKYINITCVAVAFLVSCKEECKQIFDSNIWKTKSSIMKDVKGCEESRSLRQLMFESLLKEIKGKSKAEIISFLGEPMDVSALVSGGEKDRLQPDLAYLLGPEKGFGVEMEIFFIWLDAEGRFLKYEIVVD